MPRKPQAMETVKLALELMRRIPRGRKITAGELQRQLHAEGFERDVRTIQRQLDQLSQHFDIERDDRTKPYGYQWKAKAPPSLALAHLTAKEALMLRLAEQHLHSLLPAHLLQSMEGFFAQARITLGPMTPARQEREWLNKVAVVSANQPLLPAEVQPGILETATEALFNNRWLDVMYRRPDGYMKKAPERIMPLALVQQGPTLYLIVHFHPYLDARHLAIHRISTLKDTGLTFDRPKFDLTTYLQKDPFGYGKGESIELKFQIARSAGLHLLGTRLSENQTVKEVGDDRLEITAAVVYSERLIWWLRGFGGSINISSPLNIKKII